MLTSLCHRRVFVFVTTFCLHLHLRLCFDLFLHRQQHLANLADLIFSELCQSIAATIGAQISAIRVKSFGYLGFILFGFQQTRPAPLRADPSRPEATRAGGHPEPARADCTTVELQCCKAVFSGLLCP